MLPGRWNSRRRRLRGANLIWGDGTSLYVRGTMGFQRSTQTRRKSYTAPGNSGHIPSDREAIHSLPSLPVLSRRLKFLGDLGTTGYLYTSWPSESGPLALAVST